MKSCEFFNWACKLLDTVRENEFNKGYITGVCVVLAVVLLMLIVKIIFKIVFRRRRCKEIFADGSDGSVAISISAIEDTVRTELAAFASVRINKLRLYRVRKKYMLNLTCEYNGKDGSLPNITQKVKAALYTMFQEFFGVDSVRRINIKFERLSQDKSSSLPAEADAEVQEIEAVPVEKTEEKTDGGDDDIF